MEFLFVMQKILNGLFKGELAQLAERLRGTQKVIGSNPIFSTCFVATAALHQYCKS